MHNSRRNSSLLRTRRRRRGIAYIWVLGVALIVSAVALSAVTTARISLRTTTQTTDWNEAGVLAFSATEHACTTLAANSAWRTKYANNTLTAAIAMGRGTFQWKLVDEADGNLSNHVSQPVRVYGVGRVGNAVRVYSVVLTPTPTTTFSCLNAAATVNSSFSCSSSTITALAQTIASNGSITCNSATIMANLQAAGSITPGTAKISGTTTNSVAARTMPDANVFDYYQTTGTAISISSLPQSSGYSLISSQLISPTSNPFGSTVDPNGVYIIDCQGRNIKITNSRIVGTLVLLNAGSSSVVQGSVNWVPAVTNYPSLLVQGNMQFAINSSNSLSEWNLWVNFNPPGTPYPWPNGSSNTLNWLDSFPCTIGGLVYVSGNLSLTAGPANLGMLVVGGSFTPSSYAATFQYNSYQYRNPPPGFATMVLAPVPGSWRWEAAL